MYVVYHFSTTCGFSEKYSFCHHSLEKYFNQAISVRLNGEHLNRNSCLRFSTECRFVFIFRILYSNPQIFLSCLSHIYFYFINVSLFILFLFLVFHFLGFAYCLALLFLLSNAENRTLGHSHHQRVIPSNLN